MLPPPTAAHSSPLRSFCCTRTLFASAFALFASFWREQKYAHKHICVVCTPLGLSGRAPGSRSRGVLSFTGAIPEAGACPCVPWRPMPPPSPKRQNQVHRKIAVLGFRAVGKTTLTTHFVEGRFVERYDPTIENTFQKTINFGKTQFFTEIVDSAGMDEYSRLSRNASVGVHGYLLLYAINSRNSFDKIQSIDDMLVDMHGGSESVTRVLVGTMIDLSTSREVGYEEARALADSRGIPFIECSAKENVNVSEVFTTLLRETEKDSGSMEEEAPPGCTIL